jgi:hypothetical protein
MPVLNTSKPGSLPSRSRLQNSFFRTRDQVARVGERRHHAAVDEASVPADVIDVQMRAEDIIDAFGA